MISGIRSVVSLLVMLIGRSHVVIVALLPPRVVTIGHHVWGHLRVPRRLVDIHLVAVAVQLGLLSSSRQCSLVVRKGSF